MFHIAHLYYSPLECEVFFSSEQHIKLKKTLTVLYDFKYRFSSPFFFLILL